jgi:transposase-like protein
MTRKRKQYTSEFKVKAVLEILKEEKTTAQLAGELGVHPLVLSEWKKHFLSGAPQVFERTRKTATVHSEAKERAELFEQIGRLKMELEWLKKKWGSLT